MGARPEMRDMVRRHYVTIAPSDLRIESSNLGSRAGVVGALAVALNRLHNQLFGVQDITGALTLPGSVSLENGFRPLRPAEAAQ